MDKIKFSRDKKRIKVWHQNNAEKNVNFYHFKHNHSKIECNIKASSILKGYSQFWLHSWTSKQQTKGIIMKKLKESC